MSKNLVRKTLYLTEQYSQWLEQEAEQTGLSQSNILTIALQQYVKQAELPNMIKDIQELAAKMEKIEEQEKLK